ncbi:MAG: hypothetical protein WC865_10745, partial [Bacteroidales bacterium]
TRKKVLVLNNQRRTELLSEDFKLNPTQLLINENKDTLSLISLSENPKMVLYISPNACNVCLDSLFIFMNEILGTDTSNLAIISSANGYRDILVQLANNRYKYPLYCLLNKIEIPACDTELPFIFWLDRDFITKLLFIPDKANTDNTKWYLKFIKDRFLGNNTE